MTHSFPTRRSSDRPRLRPARRGGVHRNRTAARRHRVAALPADRAVGGAAVRGRAQFHRLDAARRSEEHTSELQSLMRISYAVFCLKKKNNNIKNTKQTKNE